MTKMTPAHKKMRDRALKAESQCELYRKTLQEKENQLTTCRNLSMERYKALLKEQKRNEELSHKLNADDIKNFKLKESNIKLQGHIYGLESAISHLNISGKD